MKRMMILAIGLSLMVLAGCGSPPTEDINKAKAAQKAAMEAKADAYVTDTYAAADQAMKEGDALVAKKEYDKAKAKYVEAAKLYGDATKAAPGKMEEVKTGTDEFIKNCETAWTKNEKAMNAAAAKLKTDQKKEVEKMYAECKSKLAEAKKQFAAGDYKGSRATADDAAQTYGKINEKLASKK